MGIILLEDNTRNRRRWSAEVRHDLIIMAQDNTVKRLESLEGTSVLDQLEMYADVYVRVFKKYL